MWRTERHPTDSMTGLILGLLDVVPDWERFRGAHEAVLRIVPRFGERVVDPLLPVGTPMWVPDDVFDLDYHLRRIQVAPPGTMRQLLDLAQSLALVPLDRERPPWVGTLVEGLETGQAAYLFQVHHVLMDGIAVTQLLSRVLSPTREPSDRSWPEHSRRVGSRPASLTALRAVHQAHAVPRVVRTLQQSVKDALRHPSGTVGYLASLGRVLTPPPPSRSSVLRGGTRRQWRFAMLECPLAELKGAARVAGGTVNDAFVSALLGGVRHYCAHFGEDLRDIPISMPVSMRQPNDPIGGNRFAGAFFAAPARVADAAERIRELHRCVESVRAEPALDFFSTVAPFVNRTPRAIAAPLVNRLYRAATLTSTSWQGLPDERYVAGARLERLFVLPPLPGSMVMGTMCSHVGTCCIGINVDGEVFTHADLARKCLQRGLDEVLTLGARE